VFSIIDEGPTASIYLPAQWAVVVNTLNDTTCWKTDCGQIVSLTIVADNRFVVFVAGSELRCLSMETGDHVWSRALPRTTEVLKGLKAAPTVILYDSIVYAALENKMYAMDAVDGKEIWVKPWKSSGYTAPVTAFVLNGLIWNVNTGGEPYRPGTRNQEGKSSFSYTGHNLRTGELRKTTPMVREQGYAVMHHRCYVPRASGDYILTSFPGIEFINVTSGDVKYNSWIRGACLYGFMPACLLK